MSSGGDMWDAPNQQVVRPDQSGPWEEGDGGSPATPKDGEGGGSLLDLTKDELLAKAVELGVSPANNAMTKAELAAAIEQAEANQPQEEAPA